MPGPDQNNTPHSILYITHYKSISKVIVINTAHYDDTRITINTKLFVIMIQELKSRHDFPVLVIIIRMKGYFSCFCDNYNDTVMEMLP